MNHMEISEICLQDWRMVAVDIHLVLGALTLAACILLCLRDCRASYFFFL